MGETSCSKRLRGFRTKANRRTSALLSTPAQILHRVLSRLVHHALDFPVDLGFQLFVIGIAQPPEVREFSYYATASPENQFVLPIVSSVSSQAMSKVPAFTPD